MRRSFFFAACSLLSSAGCGDGPRTFTAGLPDAGNGAAMLAEDASAADAHAPPLSDGGTAQNSVADALTSPGTHVCGLVTDKVDLLFVVDNSGSMREEQALLTAELPRMVYALGTGDVDGDGTADFRPADLHIGVVSTDLGADLGGPNRGCSLLGDDGMLVSGCGSETGTFTVYAPSHDDGGTPDAGARDAGLRDASEPDAAWLDGAAPDAGSTFVVDPELQQALGCLVSLGTAGCGFEEPLEAALKALTPGSSDVRFARGTLGHGDGENAGFLRPDSVLAVVIVTDEEDCSRAQGSPELTWTSGGPYAAENINTRCEFHPEKMQPLARYVDGLTAVRDNPNAFVFAVIAGVPPDLVESGASIDEMLADERMQYRPDSVRREGLMPACGGEITDAGLPIGTGVATPGRRLLGVAKQFGERAVVTSICEDAFTRPIEAIFRRISGVLECPDDPVL